MGRERGSGRLEGCLGLMLWLVNALQLHHLLPLLLTGLLAEVEESVAEHRLEVSRKRAARALGVVIARHGTSYPTLVPRLLRMIREKLRAIDAADKDLPWARTAIESTKALLHSARISTDDILPTFASGDPTASDAPPAASSHH